MKKEVLIIVDMVNGFIHEGPLADKDINKITPHIIAQIKKCIDKRIPIIAFVDSHTPDAEEFKTYPVHCLAGSSQSKIIPELQPFAKHFTIIPKNTTNGFKTKRFQEIALKHKFDKVTVVGCCTDICVEDFVTTFAKFNQISKYDTQIVVPSNCVATFNSPTHNALKHHNAALERMEKLGVIVQKSHTFGE